MEINRHSNPLEQWRSYLSLKTPVLIAFFIIWNLGFLIAMFLVGDGFNAPITPKAGIAISIICFSACIFSCLVTFSSSIRQKLLAPSRAHNYCSKHFHLLSFVVFTIGMGMLFIPRLINV